MDTQQKQPANTALIIRSLNVASMDDNPRGSVNVLFASSYGKKYNILPGDSHMKCTV
jgi:hypothetical protein